MNTAALAHSAYAQVTAIDPSERNVEYRAFSRITRALSSNPDPKTADFPALADAIHKNNQLWSIIATDVASDENALPADLRARLFFLAEFSLQHGRKVLAGTENAAPLIEVNTTIMRGLRTPGKPD